MPRRHELDASEEQTIDDFVSVPLDVMDCARIVVAVGLTCFALTFIANRRSV